MNNQDFSKDFHFKLSSEFKRIDEYLAEFQHVFTDKIRQAVYKQSSEIIQKEKINEHILLYANEIFSCAESVFDKDKSYNEWRLEEELKSMTVALDKFGELERHQELAAQTHRVAKEIMVGFFPNLVDLSANGFRLLEKFCLLYNREFLASAIYQDRIQ